MDVIAALTAIQHTPDGDVTSALVRRISADWAELDKHSKLFMLFCLQNTCLPLPHADAQRLKQLVLAHALQFTKADMESADRSLSFITAHAIDPHAAPAGTRSGTGAPARRVVAATKADSGGAVGLSAGSGAGRAMYGDIPSVDVFGDALELAAADGVGIRITEADVQNIQELSQGSSSDNDADSLRETSASDSTGTDTVSDSLDVSASSSSGSDTDSQGANDGTVSSSSGSDSEDENADSGSGGSSSSSGSGGSGGGSSSGSSSSDAESDKEDTSSDDGSNESGHGESCSSDDAIKQPSQSPPDAAPR